MPDKKVVHSTSPARARRLRPLATTLGGLGFATCAHAANIATDIPDLTVRWDNTVKYSASYRLHDPDARLVAGDPPTAGQPPFAAAGGQLDDGDLNFRRGIVSNRLDLFSEFDATYQRFGMRVSGAAWYDSVYNTHNDNQSDTINSTSVPAGEFTRATRKVMGRDAEVLDAFLFMKNDPDSETAYNLRLGRHTVLYGESLFFGANGIANAQAPVDLIKALAVPGSQFKEIIRPVNQLSTQIQLSTRVSLGGYYQLQWQPTRLPASGSFLSNVDFVGAGAETLFPHTPIAMAHAADLDARNSGQGGLQVRFKPGEDVEYGLYAAVYNDKLPQILLDPAGGQYHLVYAEGIKTFGASFSTVVASANVAGEVSMRSNAPLVSGPQTDPGLVSNGGSDRLFAVGRTAHAQVSVIDILGKSPIWDGASFLAELAWNRTLKVQENPLALDPHVTRDATAFRMILEPQYFQVFSGVDMTVPIGLGYNPTGRSSAVFEFNGGVLHGGDMSLGLTADYEKRAKLSLSLVHYYGREDAFLTPNTNTAIPGLFMQTGAQSLHDRDFVSLSLQTTF